jgi:DNA-binding LacI/PurR family transcriptional regulator
MSFTIKDVAREANVSIATVSRVINGKDKVKKETREKIQSVIKKMNFMPDQAARTMINKKTKTIGMIVPLLSNEYWAELAEIVQSVLFKKGYTLIIGSSNIGQESYYSFINTFLERRVDGLIIGRLFHIKEDQSEEEKQLEVFTDQGIPIVTFDSGFTKFTSVCGDNLNSSIHAVEHLIQLGHQRIAFIGTSSTMVHRELGYRNALMLNNIEMDETIIISGRNENVHYFSQYGYNCVKQLLTDRKQFSALFCSNDLIAIGAIKALEELGIDVPGDMAIIGFDDINMASLYRPALTTVKQPIQEMGNTAVEILLEQIENPGKAFHTRKITFPMELIVRQSSTAQKIDR